jgi:hypothetical protein
MENKEIAIQGIMTNFMSVEEMTAQIEHVQQVMKNIMKKDHHYGIIPGCGTKPSLLKPGAEKLAMAFKLRPIISSEPGRDIHIIDLGNDNKNIIAYCHIINTQGIELATGIGSCSTMESKFRYRGGVKIPTGEVVPKEYWNLKKAKKMKEAIEIIGGDGFGVAKIDGIWSICEIGEKMENPDIADQYNTVLKIAKKRAFVDGILSATGASDIFTQDIDDLDEDSLVGKIIKPEPIKPEAKTTPQTKGGKVISEAQLKRLYAMAVTGAGISEDFLNKYIYETYNIASKKDILMSDYDAIINAIPNIKELAEKS